MNGRQVGREPFQNVVENVPRKLNCPVLQTTVHSGRRSSGNNCNSWNVFCAGTEKRDYAPCGANLSSPFFICANMHGFCPVLCPYIYAHCDPTL